MAVTATAGGTMITGLHINLFRMKAQLGALRLEIAGLHRSGRSAYSIIKETYQLTGTPKTVAAKFESLVNDAAVVAQAETDAAAYRAAEAIRISDTAAAYKRAEAAGAERTRIGNTPS